MALLQSSALCISPLQAPGTGPSRVQCAVYIPFTDTRNWPFSRPVRCVYPPYRYLELALLQASALYISPLQIPVTGPSPVQCAVYIPLTDTWKWPFSIPVRCIYPPYRYLGVALLQSSALYISPYRYLELTLVQSSALYISPLLIPGSGPSPIQCAVYIPLQIPGTGLLQPSALYISLLQIPRIGHFSSPVRCVYPPYRCLDLALLQSSALYIFPLQIPGTGPSPVQCAVYIPLTDTWKWPFSNPSFFFHWRYSPGWASASFKSFFHPFRFRAVTV